RSAGSRKRRAREIARLGADGLTTCPEQQGGCQNSSQNCGHPIHHIAPMLKGTLSISKTFVALARSVYPFPAWSMLKSEKVATPFASQLFCDAASKNKVHCGLTLPIALGTA